MKKVTPEECYNAFHKITNEVKGQKVRAVQNFENAKAKPEWNQFVTFAERVNRSNGMIDLRMYILALATKYEGWFQPKFLNSQVSISIYKSYMKLKELDSTDDNVKAQILKTFKHILEFCQEHLLISKQQ